MKLLSKKIFTLCVGGVLFATTACGTENRVCVVNESSTPIEVMAKYHIDGQPTTADDQPNVGWSKGLLVILPFNYSKECWWSHASSNFSTVFNFEIFQLTSQYKRLLPIEKYPPITVTWINTSVAPNLCPQAFCKNNCSNVDVENCKSTILVTVKGFYVAP